MARRHTLSAVPVDTRHNPVIVVAGPTASGKSALALRVAEEVNGVVINADSMQVYRDLRVLTARPSVEDEARAPHKLYGIMAGDTLCSAGRWGELAAAAIHEARAQGQVPIVCGGSGLYLRALMEGLSPIPAIDPALRASLRAQLEGMGNPAFHDLLARVDPQAAAILPPGDTQRMLRAMEVHQATGRSIYGWQRQPTIRPIEAEFLVFVLDPPRDHLYTACDWRFARMVEHGAIEEVKGLLRLKLPADAPVMKALGVAELSAFLRDEISLNEAITTASLATRHFAKRQTTWCRGQIVADMVLSAQYSESLDRKIFPIIRRFLLTDAS